MGHFEVLVSTYCVHAGKEVDSNVVTIVDYGVVLVSSSLSLHVIPHQIVRELEGRQRVLRLLKVNTLEWAETSWWHMSPPRASPLVPIWLVENVWFVIK